LQPSHVSKVMRRLEQKASLGLFKRATSGIILSREGRAFVEIAKRVLEESRALLSRAGPSESVARPVVTIGSLGFLNRSIVAAALATDTAGLGDFRYRLVDDPPDNLAVSALKGAFDVILHYRETGPSQNWVVTKVGGMRWGLFGRRGHPLGREASEHQGLRYPFVVPTYWTESQFVVGNDFCPVPAARRELGGESSTADGAAQLLAGTDQVSFLPTCVALGRDNLAEITISDWDEIVRPIYLMVNKDTVKKPLQLALTKALRACLGD